MSEGLRVGVIGGSISGCAAAALLSRAGHEVTVFERSPGQLASRGVGIATRPNVTRGMIERGLLDERFPRCSMIRGVNVCRGGAGERPGRWLGDASMALEGINWAHLYENLRRRVPDEIYCGGVSVRSIDAEAAGSVMVETDDGRAETFDLVVCADGYNSQPADCLPWLGTEISGPCLVARDRRGAGRRCGPARRCHCARRVPRWSRRRVSHPRPRRGGVTGGSPGDLGFLSSSPSGGPQRDARGC